MISTKETIFTEDLANKKIKVVREFDAPVDKVWRAWTESNLLDQWWAPKPWQAKTKSMDFRTGGTWVYAMQGPDGSEQWCLVEYKSISKNKSFSGTDAFCDEKGKINTEFPVMLWDVQFNESDSGTKVVVEVSFDSEEDLKKIVEMGFKEGFAAAHTNLDELLAKQ